ncbi:MAG: poly(R)-hydroxyalkanoic acid synthase subunit PhaE [Myxococcota bacterium]
MDSKAPWQTFKQAFDAWEAAASPMFESWLKSPFVIGPAGSFLSAYSQMRASQERMMSAWWSTFGLPTRSDQRRTLHAMNELQSRLIDLEEKLADLEEGKT